VTRREQVPADLTALKARLADAEAKLERLQNERVGNEFFTTLAHEFRNPLAPIRSAVEIMRVIGQKDPALEKAREMISRQVDHLSRLVDQLLDVSHITQGTIPLQKEPVDANAVLWQAVELAQPLIDERGQTVRVVPLAQPVDIEGDFERLVQVVRNLLDNAARYSDARGEIVVSAAQEDDGIAISVKDTGVGIAPESLAVVFDLFTQAHASAGRPEGLGIGLSLVRNIVELHGGSVEAKSDGLGHGSEFIVRLPLRTRAMRSGQPAKPESGREMPRRIVLIDDNVDAAESLAMLLRLKGHEVHVAFDGPAGVALALKTGPDCVLVDIGLPGIDGYEVAKRLRSHDGGATLLVALTGYGQNEDRIKSEQAGFDHHLVKPVAQNVLEALLRER
jgi:nitrogen-specific signal transduction histidine kinase/CheY-like chemotaxis protein